MQAGNPIMSRSLAKIDSFTLINLSPEKTLFQCNICHRNLSTKQKVLKHLEVIHQLSPVKRIKKRYLDDPTIPIPKRTAARHSAIKKQQSTDSSRKELFQDESLQGIPSETETVLFPYDVQVHEEIQNYSEEIDTMSNTDSHRPNNDVFDNSEQSIYKCPNSSPSCDQEDSSSYNDSDVDTEDVMVSDEGSEFSIVNYDSSSCESESEERKQQTELTEQQIKSMCFLSYSTRHNLTEAASNDLLQMMRVFYPGETVLGGTYKTILQNTSDSKLTCFDYCHVCSTVFPDNKEIYRCQTDNCTGLRYMGKEVDQTLPSRQPHCKFTIADIESQLRTLLCTTVIQNDIKKTKEYIKSSAEDFSKGNYIIHDITDGYCYRKLCEEGHFLADENAISGVFNTDGIPLYSSTKEKLWPIFISFNEIHISRRFLRENMILAGIWQGKKNPPFFEYLSAFGEVVSKLYYNGFLCQGVQVKFGVVLGSVDLQAKGYVMNMSMHNGLYGCSTCEEPGKTVRSGKGYSRQYPFRKEEDRFATRTSEEFISASIDATRKQRCKGICGPSGLLSLPDFDIILGMVPDYMHCVLLGITKTLLMKFLSPTNSGKPYFVGKNLNNISERLRKIKPPDYLDRLPRDLASNYQNLKATELQAWLLYYSIPCLRGYLPDKYLRHLAHLAEGIYICLGDAISESDLKRSQFLLESFYKNFAELYGEGSCGLNVHNAGVHMCQFVRQWGPLYGWSCFGFEDANSELLSFAHGTGDVTQQLVIRASFMRIISSFSEKLGDDKASDIGAFLSKMNKRFSRKWKSTKYACNCNIAGAVFKVQVPEYCTKEFLLVHCGAADLKNLKEILRIEIEGEKYYAKKYKKKTAKGSAT